MSRLDSLLTAPHCPSRSWFVDIIKLFQLSGILTHLSHSGKVLFMRVFIAVIILIFGFQSFTKAEDLILKCSGVSIISEGETKPLESVYKKVINLDKKTTYRSDNPDNVHNIIITDNYFYEYNVDVENLKTEERLDFGSLLQIRSMNRLNGSLTIITKHNSNFTYERLRKELNKVNSEIEAQQDEKYITKKSKKYITKKSKKYITKKSKKYITKKSKKYITKKSKKYITKKHVIESFFVSNATTEQELKKYNIVKRNVMSILNSKTRTIAKYQCKNEAYK